MKELIRFLAVCLWLTTQYVSAKEVKGLYSVEVIAHSQSREDRNLALREALVIVLSRIVASEGLMLNPAINEALSNAASYADEYQYILTTNSFGDVSQRKMKISFNEKAILELMHSSGLAIWKEMRDEVLVWIVLEQRRKQVLFDAEQQTEFKAAFLAAAQLKGIPVLFPLMDLEERQNVSVVDISNANSAKIQEISIRYDVSAVLSGKVIKQRSCWRSEWTLSFDNRVEQWTIPCENLTANLLTALQQVYDRLSLINAVKSR